MIVKGKRIRALREQKKYTLQDLAQQAGLSPSYLSEIERGSKHLSLKTINKLAVALDVPESQLVEGDIVTTGLPLGDKIGLLRSQKGFSPQELARRAGLSLSYLNEIERGAVYPALNTLKKIAVGLEIEVSTLINQKGFLGHKLKALREEYGLTQAQLASLAGVTAGLIGQIEHGKVQPSLKTLEKIAEVMGVSPCYFIVEPGAVDQILGLMNPELREILMHPNVQTILGQVCNFNEKEMQFVLNFIQLLKRSKIF